MCMSGNLPTAVRHAHADGVAYAKEVAPQEYWNSSLFLHINYAISAVWAAAFTASAVISFSMILQDRCPAELFAALLASRKSSVLRL